MKKHALPVKLLLPAILLALLAFIPRGDDPIEKLVAALQNWADNNPQEKVYLHTDRPWYSIGDTIWYKAYVTIGSRHQLSAKSGSLYVELINGADSITKILRLPVMAGMAKGCFALTSEMHEGNYRLRSYTQWMRNAGSDYFYDHAFIVKNSGRDSVFTKIEYVYESGLTGKQATAIITFTNRINQPLAFSEVRYNLRKNYKTLFKGIDKTDDKGVLRIPLKTISAAQLKGSHLATVIELADFSIVKKTFSIKSVAMQADVQFFAEGGNMVADLTNRIAFKAIGSDGLGVAVKGEVTENGSRITTFESKHLGMGSFEFKPLRYHSYTAKVTYADGSTKEVALPQVQDTGYLLAVKPDLTSDSVMITVATPPQSLAGYLPPVHLIVQSGGEVYYTATLPIGEKPASLRFSTRDIPSGIAQLTLFSNTGTPLNERIIFVQNYDKMNVELKAEKTVYKRHEKVNLAINTQNSEGDANVSNFSVSVINEDDVPGDENKATTIFSHLLLSADIKGYIEQPNYYFNNPTATTKQNRDLLMLTQGYRRFNWADLAAGRPIVTPYRAESLASEISGKLIGLWGFKIPYGNVGIINDKTGITLYTKTDKDGRFSFNNLVLTDGLDFTVAGRRAKNGTRLEVLIDKFTAQKQSENPNVGDMVTDFTRIIVPGQEKLTPAEEEILKQRLALGKLLKEVPINSKLAVGSANASEFGAFGNPMSANYTVTITDKGGPQVVYRGNSVPPASIVGTVTRGRLLTQVSINANRNTRNLTTSLPAIKGQIIESIIFNEFDADKTPVKALKDRYIDGLKFSKFSNKYKVFIDGQQAVVLINDKIESADKITDILDLWDSEDIIKIDVVRPNGVTPPALLIYTRRSYIFQLINPLDPGLGARWMPEITVIRPRGFDKVKEFYVPKYEAALQPANYSDFRTTIYWNPSVLVKDGNAVFSFYNGDKAGNYKVVVEGIDADGLLGRQVYRYKVE